MVMRYYWGHGIGHLYSHHAVQEPAIAVQPSDNFRGDPSSAQVISDSVWSDRHVGNSPGLDGCGNSEDEEYCENVDSGLSDNGDFSQTDDEDNEPLEVYSF